MAVITNTLLTYGNLTNPEFVDNAIKFVSPDDTPFIDMVPEDKTGATKHEWIVDKYDAVGTNAQLEGDDTSFGAITAPTRPSNNTQILKKAFVVSGTQNAIKSYGVEDTFGYHAIKKTTELMRDLESGLMSNQAPVTGAAGTARQFRPVEGFYSTNVDMGAGGANGSAAAARTDGTLRSLTLTMITTAAQNIFTQGGKASVLMVNPSLVNTVGAFAGSAVRQTEANKVETYVDVIRTAFGNLKVVPNRYTRARSIHVLDPKTHKIVWLRKPKREELAKTGDARKMQIIGEVTYSSKAEHGNALIADVQ